MCLYSGINFSEPIVGISHFGSMCYDYAVGIVQASGLSTAVVGSIAAHELGHIFGIQQDEGRKLLYLACTTL